MFNPIASFPAPGQPQGGMSPLIQALLNRKPPAQQGQGMWSPNMNTSSPPVAPGPPPGPPSLPGPPPPPGPPPMPPNPGLMQAMMGRM